jgi:hypothetical protein
LYQVTVLDAPARGAPLDHRRRVFEFQYDGRMRTLCRNLTLNPVDRPGRELPRGYFCAVTPP